MREEMRRLIDQMLWANRTWVEYVHSSDGAEPRAHQLLAHIMVGEKVWLHRVIGKAPLAIDSFGPLSREELLRGLADSHETLRELIASRLFDDVDFTRQNGDRYHARVIDIIHHLVTHGHHHRGQLAALYARKGVKYPNTDHIQYLIANAL